MKKYVILTLVGIFCLMINGLFGQHLTPFPIPSYNVNTNGNAIFEEQLPTTVTNTEAKRRMNVIVICHRLTLFPCYIQVMLYSLDGLDILGPYNPACGELLTVDIDEREWGVWVQTDCDVEVSVWASDILDGVLSKNNNDEANQDAEKALEPK